MVKLETALILFIIVIVGLGCYTLGRYQGIHENPEIEMGEISYTEGIIYLNQSARSHQQVIDNPSLLDGVDTTLMGDLQFHQNCIYKYEQLKDLLQREHEN